MDSLIQDGWLKTPRIIKAFRKIKRADFLPDDMHHLADLNEALPIGWGQTISQPLVVAFMLELLQPESNNKILDIGAGSGWTSALLSEIVAPKGKIFAIERIPELKAFGEKNAAKYNFIEKGLVKFICADGSRGYSKEAPFDGILASASAEKIPQTWQGQIKTGGRIVASVKYSIWFWRKRENGTFEETEYPGFSFVPLILDQ